jgi:cell division protein FtsB
MKASLTRFVYLIVFLVAVGYAFVAFPKGMHAWQEKQRQIQEMEKRNASLAQQVERQKEYINRLKNNPAAQELEIRKRLKLLHPEEKLTPRRRQSHLLATSSIHKTEPSQNLRPRWRSRKGGVNQPHMGVGLWEVSPHARQ